MKMRDKLLMALCVALMLCLAVPAALPTNGAVPGAALAASKVKLNKTKATLYSGKTLKLKVSGTGKKASWSSSDKSVAKVSAKGVVTGIKAGKATITARVGGKALKCAVTVRSSLKAGATEVTLEKGKSKSITLTWQLSGKVSFEWDDASVIRCSLGKFKNKKAKLTIKALRPGTSTITLTNSKTKDVVRIRVTVTGGGASGSVVDRTAVTVQKGKSAEVQVTWSDAANPIVDFDPGIVEVTFGAWNGSGWPLVIQGVARGTTDVALRRGKDGPVVATIRVAVN